MPTPVLPQQNKKLDPNDPNPCSGCSYCCEYMAIEIDRPETVRDFDNIYWYVIHKDVWVYVDFDNDWYVQFNTPCEKLEGHLCGNYFNRPMMCREYKVEDCSRYGEGGPDEKILIRNEVDLFQYLAKKRPVLYEKLKERINLKETPTRPLSSPIKLT